MAIKIFEKYGPTRANAPTADFPEGSLKNETVPGANDGTPLDQDWGNDYAGFDSALFAETEILQTGATDTALISQRLDAILRLNIRPITSAKAASSTRVSEGQYVVLSDRDHGLFEYRVGQSPNTFNIIECTGVPSLSLVLVEGQTDIKKWGAVDGQDASGVIQAILDAGLNPHIPRGSFLISTSLSTTVDGQFIRGDGIGISVLVSDGLSTNQGIIETENLENISVHDISLDCNAETYMGIRATLDNPGSNKRNLLFKNIKVFNTFDTVTSLFGGITVDNKQGAIFTYQYEGVNINNCIFDTDTVSHSSHGCLVAYAKNVSFCDNEVISAGFHGMEAVGCTGVIESRNIIGNCFESGLGVGANTKNFIISKNIIDNCDGDGAITVEQNSVQGEVTNNVLTECTNNGINVSFGTSGGAPFNEINNITVANNIVMAAASSQGRIGINAYSSTGAGIGDGIKIRGNLFDGFATGLECTWLSFLEVSGNTVRRFGNVSGTRPQKRYATIVGCDKFNIEGVICDQDPTDHAILIDTSLVANSRGSVIGGTLQSATLGALVRKEGSGDITVKDLKTFGAVNYVSCDGTQDVTMDGNTGPLSGLPISGGVIVNRIERLSASPEGVIAGRIGAMATRSDTAVGSKLYIKESNDTGNTGWVAK